MKRVNWLIVILLLAQVFVFPSCSDDDGYSVGDIGWDWATIHATGGGGYYLEGDRWGHIDPVASSIPWFKPVDGERVIAFFNPLLDTDKGVQAKIEGIQELLTKDVQTLTPENEADFGNDPIVIYEGDMWLGGDFLNLIFHQNLPYSKKHLISLVTNTLDNEPLTLSNTLLDEEGYVHLELRYNTYNDLTNYWGVGRVSFNLEDYYLAAKEESLELKGFKVTINSQAHGEGRVVILNLDHSITIPESAKDSHSTALVQ